MIETRPHIHSLGNWPLPDKRAVDDFRPNFISQRARKWIETLSDPQVQSQLRASMSDSAIGNVSVAIGAFELGVWQVYRKVGYSDAEVVALIAQQMNLRRSVHPLNTDIFAYHTEKGFMIYVDALDIAMRYAIANYGNSPVKPIELLDIREMNALQVFELAGVEEAAHSLYTTHHPGSAIKDQVIDPSDSLTQRHFRHPIERAALKWKRNYALRFMPSDVAQGFVDFENGLADR